jgi:transposase
VEVPDIMRALEREVVDAVWAAVEPLLPPPPPDAHPLGCHRRRVPERVCFEAMLVRLVTGCSWVDTEALCGRAVSDTTLRARRDEWERAGVFQRLADEAIKAYDRIVGLALGDCALDGSAHKSPVGGEGTGANSTDRAKRGWKWSLLTDTNGIPLGWATDGANRQDIMLVEPTLIDAAGRVQLTDIETLHLDRGYDNRVTRRLVIAAGIDDVVCARRRPKSKNGHARAKQPVALGLRWPVERTNSWLSNFGQLRRNTDRQLAHRLAQFAFAVALLLTAKLIDWRDRWSRPAPT